MRAISKLPVDTVAGDKHIRFLAVSSVFLLIALFLLQGGKTEPLSTIAQGLLFLCAALSMRVQFPETLRRHPLVPAAFGIFFWTLMSTAVSGSWGLGVVPLLKIAACGAIWVTAGTLWGNTHRGFFLAALRAVASVQSSILLLAHAGVTSSFLLLPGNPQYMAFWMTLAALTSLDDSLKSPAIVRRASGVGLAAFSALGLFALPSRSGLAAFFIGVFYLLVRRFRWRGAFYLPAAFLAAMVLIPNSAWEGSLKTRDPLAWKRLDIWASAVNGIAAKPLFGWGPGNFASLYDANARPQESLPVRFDRSTPFAHNDFLQAAAEYGIPAMLLLVFGVVSGLAGKLASGDKAVLIGASVFSLFNFPFFLPVNGWLFAALLSPGREEGGSARRPPGPGWVMTGVFVALAMVSFASAGLRGFFHVHPWNAAEVLDEAGEKIHGMNVGADDVRKSEGLLDKVLRFDPGNARAWRDLAHLQSDHVDPPRLEESRRSLDRAIALHPYQALWTLERGAVALRQGDTGSALRAAHRALALEPGFAEAALFLGAALRQAGESARAEAWLTGYLRRHKPSIVPMESLSPYARTILHFDADAFHLEIARCQSAQKNHAKALETLSRIQTDPKGARAFEEAGIHFAMENYAKAEDSLRRAMKADRNNPAYARNLALVRRKNK